MRLIPLKGIRESLKFRVTVIAIFVHLSIWLVAVAFSSWTAVNVIFDSLDDELKTQAEFVDYNSRVFIDFVASLDIEIDADIGMKSISASDSLGWTGNPMVYWTVDRQFIYRTQNAPLFKLPTQAGFFDEAVVQNGKIHNWRVYYHLIDGTAWVTVGADTHEARQAAIQVGVRALYPMALIIPLTILGIYWSTARGLNPIRNLARDVASRSPTSLEPVDTSNIHYELRPLIDALNNLMAQLSGALENEHRFTANAAHELQTPLTAIKAEVQMRQRGVSDPEISAMLGSIGTRVDRAVHTVRQLLTLARLESLDTHLSMDALNLHVVVQEALADHANLALERNITIDFPEDENWPIIGQADALQILVGNLLTNAFRYALPGTAVVIRCERAAPILRFSVVNECDPMTADERDQLVDRFYRRPGTDTPGAGLGLSIVQRIVDVHSATLTVAPLQHDHGLQVILEFPV